MWKISHYHQNRKLNTVEEFDNLTDALTEAMTYQEETPGTTYIENMSTGEWGVRTWNEPKIEWHKSNPAAMMGAAKSERKAATSRENGKRGGRPRSLSPGRWHGKP